MKSLGLCRQSVPCSLVAGHGLCNYRVTYRYPHSSLRASKEKEMLFKRTLSDKKVVKHLIFQEYETLANADFLLCKLMHTYMSLVSSSKTKILAFHSDEGGFGFGFLPPGYGFD